MLTIPAGEPTGEEGALVEFLNRCRGLGVNLDKCVFLSGETRPFRVHGTIEVDPTSVRMPWNRGIPVALGNPVVAYFRGHGNDSFLRYDSYGQFHDVCITGLGSRVDYGVNGTLLNVSSDESPSDDDIRAFIERCEEADREAGIAARPKMKLFDAVPVRVHVQLGKLAF
jgi:hypothetical protein